MGQKNGFPSLVCRSELRKAKRMCAVLSGIGAREHTAFVVQNFKDQTRSLLMRDSKGRPYRHPEIQNHAAACLGGVSKRTFSNVILSHAKDPAAQPPADVMMDPSLRSG
jgi:hypothetical protein